MRNNSILHRFNEYQKERFPFAVLIFTTLSVVLSSAAIVAQEGQTLYGLALPIIVGTITCLLFMLNVRVFDDFKDRDFDDKFHEKRPVQIGLITLKELNYINYFSIAIQVLINSFVSINAFLYWILAMAYSLVARAEFFMKDCIRKRFVLYNTLNLMQMFFLQIYLYALIAPGFSFKDPLLFIHLVFVLSNAVILEVARKLKAREEESLGKDTYSGRYGIKTASVIYAGSYLLVYLLFLIIFLQIGYSRIILLLSLVSLALAVNSSLYYYFKRSRLSAKIIKGVAVLFYLSMHLLIMGAKFL